MTKEELRERRAALKKNTDITLSNMELLANESNRVAHLAHNSKEILNNLDAEFERQTGLDKVDVTFLFFATALQVGRWVVINKLNEITTKKINSSRVKDNDSAIRKMDMRVSGLIIKAKTFLHG